MVSHDAATIVTSTTMQWMPTKGKPSTARSSTTTTTTTTTTMMMMPARPYQWSSRAHQLVCISRITLCLFCLLSFPVLKRMRSFAQKLFTRYPACLASNRASKCRSGATNEGCVLCRDLAERAAKCPTTVAKIGLHDVSCGQKICRICPAGST